MRKRRIDVPAPTPPAPPLAAVPGASPPAAVDRLVARQPIVGTDDQLVAFELLHRATPDVAADSRTEDTVTVSAFLGDVEVDVAGLVGELQLFCEAAPEVLAGTTAVTLPKDRTVLLVPAEAGADADIVERCRALVAEGYAIAVDRLSWCEGVEALLELADAVKIDLETNSREQTLELVAQCRPYDVTLLAARCQTRQDLLWATMAGFELFSGPAVQRPVEVSGNTLAPSALAQVQLATELLDERVDFSRVEAILSHEPALVVQVLRYASLGADGGLRREVHSVREALVLLGTVRLRQWAALAVLGRQVSDVRTDALAVALVRARMCELLAQTRGIERGFAFTAGLLSALDRLLGVPMSEVESRVDIDEAIAAAAFRRETPLGELVGQVADYQDSVDTAEPAPAGLGDVALIAAMSFCWAMHHIHAIEKSRAAA